MELGERGLVLKMGPASVDLAGRHFQFEILRDSGFLLDRVEVEVALLGFLWSPACWQKEPSRRIKEAHLFLVYKAH